MFSTTNLAQDINISEVFDVKELQHLQDLFSEVHQVASLITLPNGVPLTNPSGFCRFCSLVRSTERGTYNCICSDSALSKLDPERITVKKCQSAGLWGARVSITVGMHHVGNWMIGQLRTDDNQEEDIRKYAKEIGLDEEVLFEAYQEVPVMDEKKFRKIADLLSVFVKQISDNAYKQIKIKESNKELIKITENLPEIVWKGEYDPQSRSLYKPFISTVADDLLELPSGTINNDFENFFSHVEPKLADKLKNDFFEEISRSDVINSGVYPISKANGEVAWFESRGKAHKDGDKYQVYGVTEDITEKRKVTNELAESKMLLEKITDNLPNLFVSIIEKDFTIGFSVGNEFKRINLDPNSFIGLSLEDLLREQQYEYVKKIFQKTFEGEECQFELKVNDHFLKVNTIPLKDVNRETERILSVAENISFYKEKEREIEEARKKEHIVKERLRLAMDVTLDGPWDWDLKTNKVHYSDRWKEILGYNPDELSDDIGVWAGLLNPKYSDAVTEVFQKHIAGGLRKFEVEFQMKHKDGHWVDILSRAKAIFDDQGKAVRLIGTHIDITEEKKAKLLVEENEKRFRELAEHLPSGIAVYKPVEVNDDFVFIDFNKAAERITNATKESIIGNTLLNAFPNMRGNPLHNALMEVNRTGQYKYIPPFYYKDDVREGWRENYIYKLPNDEIVAIFKDVTDLKVSELKMIEQNQRLVEAKELAEQNEYRFRALHNASFGGIVIHDKGVILDCNYGLSKMTGFSHNELIGMDGLLLIAEEYRESVMNNINSEYEKSYEAAGLRKNGEKYPMRLEARMIPYNGKLARVVEFRDVTDIKESERALIEAKEKAEESDRLKTAFLANMSHEIRTPMNGILGFIELLQMPDLTEEQREDFWHTINISGERLMSTINDIIELSKIEIGDIPLLVQEVDLEELFKYHIDFFTSRSQL